jgi:hypothetical protein
MRESDAARDQSSAWPYVVALVGVLLIYAGSATHLIELPGVYMDAVNPDYLVAKVLNRAHANPLIGWVLPGNYLANRFPVLVSLYHGLQQFWLALPLYALFGMGVVGIRLTHMVFAMGVLIAMLVLFRRARIPLAIAALAGAAIAADPTFVFAFRTQSYITLAPAAWMLLSIAALAMPVGGDRAPTVRRHYFVSGVCFGFAALGYFVYAFYLPAMLGFMLAATRRDPAQRGAAANTVRWLAGLTLGCAYYVLGYALVARKVGGGIAGLIGFIDESTARLAAFETSLSLAERLAAATAFVESVFTNGWHRALMFNAYGVQPLDAPRMLLLLVVPLLLFAYAEMRGRSTPLLRVAIALPCSFFAMSLIFGKRLGGHHFMSMLPLAYVALAAGLAALQPIDAARRARLPIIALTLLCALAAINLASTERDFATLAKTGGVGLYSDAVNHLASGVAALPPATIVYFPDWGLALPVTLITGGRIATSAAFDVAEARRILCSGRDVAIAIVGDDARRFSDWTRELQWQPPRVTIYAQRDGVAVAQLGVYAGASRADSACGAH